MDSFELMKARHSVRVYSGKPIEDELAALLRDFIAQCNSDGGLNIQLCLNEPEAFGGIPAHYGRFRNTNDYIALVGQKSDTLPEKCGYYGEKIVLKMTELGLCSCWVGGSYSKNKTVCEVGEREKLICVIAFGYADDNGAPRKTKSVEALSNVSGEMPVWFRRGMEAAQLAPTAMNQQSFKISLNGNSVTAKAGIGVYTKLDLGIVKYHFELGAGDAEWNWA